jgi:arabinofuranosyltransferase
MKRANLIAPLLLFVSLQTLFLTWVPDDACISFTYARHWADGNGLSFFSGERVEGFSNLLWTLYLAAAGRIGLDIVGTAVATSVLASIIAQALILALLCRVSTLFGGEANAGRRSPCLWFAFASSAFFPFVFYATSGLESAAYLLFLLLGAHLQIRGMLEDRPAYIVLACWAFLAVALLRPEGILFCAGSLCFAVIAARPLPGRAVAGMILPFALFLGVAAAKARYFGAVLPNTYYAKPGCSFGYVTPLVDGTFYLLRFFIKSAFLLLLPFAFVPPRDSRRLRIWLYLWVLVCAQLFFIVYVGVDVLRFDRFILPLFPFYLALVLAGVYGLSSEASLPLRRLVTRIAAVACSLIMLSSAGQMAMARSKPCVHDWMQGGSLRTLGLLLGRALPPGSAIAANEVGAIAYYSGCNVIDMLGLTDRTISRIRYASYLESGTGNSPESVVKIRDYILSRNPDAVILPSYTSLQGAGGPMTADAMDPLWATFFQSKRFRTGYERVLSIAVNDRKHINVYVRGDVPWNPPDRPPRFPHGCGRVEWRRQETRTGPGVEQ